jgi:hypothetical protein
MEQHLVKVSDVKLQQISEGDYKIHREVHLRSYVNYTLLGIKMN